MLRTPTSDTAGFGMAHACHRLAVFGLCGMGVGLLAACWHLLALRHRYVAALIAGLRHHAVRASRLFADSSLMGTQSVPRFTDPRTMLEGIRRLGGHHISIVRIANEPAFPHSRYPAETMQLPESPSSLVAMLRHGWQSGATEVHARTLKAHPGLDAVPQQGIPAKVSNVITIPL